MNGSNHSVARTAEEHFEEIGMLRESNDPIYRHDEVRSGYHCADLRFVDCDCREEH